MKFIRLGPSRKNICIGDDMKKGEWYSITDGVRAMCDTLVPDQDVTIKYDVRNVPGKPPQRILLELALGQGGATGPAIAPTPSTFKPAAPGTSASNGKPAWSGTKTPAEQSSIKHQAIGHMVSRTLIGLHGQLTDENIEPIIRKLYTLYTSLVG